MIIGQDILFYAIGLNVHYETATMNWDGMTVVMKDENFPTCNSMKSKLEIRQIIAQLEEEPKVSLGHY